jgi:methionyl aminopeptidase
MLAAEIRPGITTMYLDRLAENFIRDHKAKPGFLGLYDFPNTLCISVNEMVVHGIPNNKPLIEGDIVSIDCGVLLNGFYGDQAYTFPVGDIKPEVNQLLEVTKRSLYLGIEQLVAGNRIGDVSHAIQSYTEKHGYGVVRELVGHGLGRKMHESPEVPNYGRKGSGPMIKNGLVVAIEPMINLGTRRVKQLKDGWTIVTQDSKPSAHYEHNVAVIDGKPEILTTFSFVEDVMEKINN